MGNAIAAFLFAALAFGIWLSFRLFMRGDTANERVAALLPPGFKPDFFYKKGDTYVGYDKKRNSLVLVDWPHAKVLTPSDVRSLEPVHESWLGITHHWLAVNVSDPDFARYKIWFQFRPAMLRRWHGQLAEICKKWIYRVQIASAPANSYRSAATRRSNDGFRPKAVIQASSGLRLGSHRWLVPSIPVLTPCHND